MEEHLWKALEKKMGARRDDRATWSRAAVSGLRRLRTHRVFAPIGGDATRAAVDALLGAERWKEPKHWGQLLVGFPQPDAEWNVPWRTWHTDYPYSGPVGRVFALLVFSFVSDVPAQAGGTTAVAGSHRVVSDFVASQAETADLSDMRKTRMRLLQSDPWLRDLSRQNAGPEARLMRFMQNETEVRGTPVRVVELCGEAGDVIVAHPWLLHAPAANCGQHPRMMCVARVMRGPRRDAA